MDRQSYNDAVASASNQPLGGKEFRFPVGGLSDSVSDSRLAGACTPAAFNVLFRVPHKFSKSGGTRPGLSSVNAAVKPAHPDEIVYRDRLVTWNGSVWMTSRTGKHDDFDFGGDSGDPTRATAGNVALAGASGESITAAIPVNDRFLFVATRRAIRMISGEPISATAIVSDGIGVISRDAWCFDGVSRVWFVGENGLYAMNLGEPPVLVTPHLRETFAGRESATLVYDPCRNGIHILNSYEDAFFDIENSAYWPMVYPQAIRPTGGGTASVNGVNQAVFTCADGATRRWVEAQSTDGGTAIPAALALGPVVHTTGNTEQAFLAELSFEFGENTNTNIYAALYSGKTSNAAEARATTAVCAAQQGSSPTGYDRDYAAVAGWNVVMRPRLRCNAFAIVLWSDGGRWSLSKITAVHRGCGRIR